MRVKLEDGSGERVYRFIQAFTDRHKTLRVYLRRRGHKPVRLLETPGTRAFDLEYQAAFAGEPTAAPKRVETARATTGTLAWLCQRYYESSGFQALGPSTRKVRRGILDAIAERGGTLPFNEMTTPDVARLRDQKAAFPEAANARVKALRQLFKWACNPEYAYATANPAMGVEYLRSNNPDGFKEWTEEEVSQYEVRHKIGSKARLALDLILYTGVRRSDLVRLGPQMERDGHLVFTETKGRGKMVKEHAIPIFQPLRASIDATRCGHLVYLITEWGRPHSVKAFGNWFAKRIREAGLKGVSAHGLRKCGARRCVEAGATEHQLMALFGWTTTKQAALYTRKASRAKLEAVGAGFLAGGAKESGAVVKLRKGKA